MANFIRFQVPKRSELRSAMSAMLERASFLLDCTEWDIFKRALSGSSVRTEKQYTAYLETGDLPAEVANYIHSLPYDENQNIM